LSHFFILFVVSGGLVSFQLITRVSNLGM